MAIILECLEDFTLSTLSVITKRLNFIDTSNHIWRQFKKLGV